VQLFSIEIIAEKAVLHLVTHHLHKNSFHCFSLQPPAWHTLFSFNCVFFFLNDLFRAFRCTGIFNETSNFLNCAVPSLTAAKNLHFVPHLLY